MKQVLLPTTAPVDFISFADLKRINDPLVGFITAQNKKVILIKTSFASEKYFARALEEWEQGNGYEPASGRDQTVEEWCKFLVSTNNAKIFLFDTPKEMFKWLSE